MDSVFIEGLQCVERKPLGFKAVAVISSSEASQDYSLLAENAM